MPASRFKSGGFGLADQRDKRARRRVRVNLAGLICFGPAVMADCTIRDLSELGARLQIGNVLGLPPEVLLVILSEGVVFRARWVWSKPPLFGVEFLEADDLARTTRPAYAALRRTWQAWRERAEA